MENIKKNKGGRKSLYPADFEESYQNAKNLDELRQKYNVHKDTIGNWQKKVKNKRNWKLGRPSKIDETTIKMVKSMFEDKLSVNAIADKMKLSNRSVYYILYTK
ncbi:helix-turn-helix domain-containing protein [Acetobacter okinawensis]|uniref:helix-turn-helix domain-containing protein n=1 Tax=Acetobacter okinawensis TaxID=1076594 RepID=UPI001BA5B2ED|nr:helix-turn-helix domain-containing protein [Acetobacter okinawensis]MBS0987314.1 helix-turn-helix domain-containing protein [Acetobacter okinawensis]